MIKIEGDDIIMENKMSLTITNGMKARFVKDEAIKEFFQNNREIFLSYVDSYEELINLTEGLSKLVGRDIDEFLDIINEEITLK